MIFEIWILFFVCESVVNIYLQLNHCYRVWARKLECCYLDPCCSCWISHLVSWWVRLFYWCSQSSVPSYRTRSIYLFVKRNGAVVMKDGRQWQLQGLGCIHLGGIGVCLGGQIQISFSWITEYMLTSPEPCWLSASFEWGVLPALILVC